MFQSGRTTLFQFGIHSSAKGLGASWERPQHFESDGEYITKVRGPIVRRIARSVRPMGEDLELTFDDPEPNSEPDVFRVHCETDGTLTASYALFQTDPVHLARASANRSTLGRWDVARAYPVVTSRPTNAEMTAIFEADQKDRMSPSIDWTVVSAADKKRRARTQQLLDSGALQSGDDFYHAAFLFQHGDGPNDHLKAHLLAMIAVARGKPQAVWIASATLDRYLQSIGQSQVLGTQYRVPRGGKATQEPYDRTLASDAMRRALRVPPLAEQEQQRQSYDEAPATEGKTSAP
ncbi:hypothetical protein NZL82_04720 [Sphingomonas sanguinis]|uniref:hypothetical protein n=1 Tax=Sphingomonas sp. LC-1 TaxID=3110957 RepID=UPI0021BA5F20|nr:hypothetical protein [Sphingomonas sp. LC-1]MCT8001178.1 hypothetical protein [Sphingomonas sp. LC-1]